MFKIKHLLIFILPLFFVGLITTKTFARALTSTERKEYAQSNILFYQPCDTEADCERSNANADAADPVDASDPDNPGTPDAPGTNPPSGGGDPGDPFTPSGSGAALIASTARAMAWPTSAGTCRDSSGNYVGWTPSTMDKNAPCQDTMSDYLKSIGISGLIRDCGKFVGLVIRKTVDFNFRASGVRYQISYMKNSSKWAKVSTDGQAFSITNLRPGDILAFSENGSGHIVIWLGNQSVPCSKGNCQINIASSSTGNNPRTPSLNKLTRMKQCTSSGTCSLYQVFRWVGE